MLIGITGASGFIGRNIIDFALRRGHEVVAFSREPRRVIPGCEMRAFSLASPPDITSCEAIIHLAGEPIVGLWTAAKKRAVLESRRLGTRCVVEAINAASQPPEVFISASGIGLYAGGGDAELTEKAPAGTGFIPETVRVWEAEALQAQRTRLVLLRTSLVLGRRDGALKFIAPIFRAGLGGRVGDGQQWMSWIHIDDEARLALFAMENLDVAGPLNAAAPWPVRNAEFTRSLARVIRRPALFRVPALVVRAFGDFARELVESKRVVPAAATEHGFGFNFPALEPALRNLLA